MEYQWNNEKVEQWNTSRIMEKWNNGILVENGIPEELWMEEQDEIQWKME